MHGGGLGSGGVGLQKKPGKDTVSGRQHKAKKREPEAPREPSAAQRPFGCAIEPSEGGVGNRAPHSVTRGECIRVHARKLEEGVGPGG